STPPGPVTVPPLAPTATVPSSATNWVRVKLVVLWSGAVVGTNRTSSIVAGSFPVTEPSLPTVSERTMPLVWSTISTREPGGKEPGGALTATSPSASGKAKARASGLKLGGVTALVVKVTAGTAT